MSVQVLRVRFPGLLIAVSVERPRHRREGRLLSSNPAKMERNRLARRFSPVTGIEPSLIKLQM
jgi:hypothetical protein